MVNQVMRSPVTSRYRRIYMPATCLPWRERTTWWVGHLLVAVKDGRTRELVRRETIADLLSRDRV
jgi:hypothetical protein